MAGLIKGTLGGGASFQGMEAGLFRQVRFSQGAGMQVMAMDSEEWWHYELDIFLAWLPF